MELMFEITHGIMAICVLSIVYIGTSMPATSSNDLENERSAIVHLVLKAKSMRVSPISIYRAAAGLLALFIK